MASPYTCSHIPLRDCPVHRWATILRNVSIKAILMHNFWEKNRIKRYNFVGQHFFHRWSDRKKNETNFPPPMKRYNIPRYKSFTDEATPHRSPFSKMYRLQRFWKLYRLKRENLPARLGVPSPTSFMYVLPLPKNWHFPFFKLFLSALTQHCLSLFVEQI